MISKSAQSVTEKTTSIQIRKADFMKDLPWMMNMYAQYASQFNGPIVRTNERYWTQWIKSEPAKYYMLESSTVRNE